MRCTRKSAPKAAVPIAKMHQSIARTASDNTPLMTASEIAKAILASCRWRQKQKKHDRPVEFLDPRRRRLGLHVPSRPLPLVYAPTSGSAVSSDFSSR
jgi:hypothetical protein